MRLSSKFLRRNPAVTFLSARGSDISMTNQTNTDDARIAYDALARDYDAFTVGYAHDRWFASIHALVQEVGLPGRRALDVACGTGKSTEPLILNGYATRACDISSEMIEVARERLPEHADSFFVADMRDLPDIQQVDLVLCLDDAVNYLLAPDEMRDTFRGVARSLSPGGLVVFDVNTVATYRTTFAQTVVKQTDEHFFAWQGRATADMKVGEIAIAELETFVSSDSAWERRSSRHVQRHHPQTAVTAAFQDAGLDCYAIYGQRRGGLLERRADEDEHIKFVYIARRP
jgi:ubiquinone/menaquinone biosynthesis C-methylase UbiE